MKIDTATEQALYPGHLMTDFGRCSRCNRRLELEEWQVDEDGLCCSCAWERDKPKPCHCGDNCCGVAFRCGYRLIGGYLVRWPKLTGNALQMALYPPLDTRPYWMGF